MTEFYFVWDNKLIFLFLFSSSSFLQVSLGVSQMIFVILNCKLVILNQAQ